MNSKGEIVPDSIPLPPSFPTQQISSLNSQIISYEVDYCQNISYEVDYCDSCSCSSSSCSDSDDDEINLVKRKEVSTMGSFSESLHIGINMEPMFRQPCLIPSLSMSSNASPIVDNMSPQTLFKRESKTNSASKEKQIMYAISPISFDETHHSNNDNCYKDDDYNIIGKSSKTENAFSNNTWLQSSTECYSNPHSHTLLPVVLEEEEEGAISSSPDLQQNIHQNSEKEIKKNMPKVKSSNLCSSISGESLDTILSTHKFHKCTTTNRNHDYDISDLKVDPTNDTIGSDTYQTQSLSNYSLSTTSKDHERSLSPSTSTCNDRLEEELESRLNVIMALKDTVLEQNKKSKKAAKLHMKTNSKLVSCTKSNKKLKKRNQELQEQVISLEKEMKEMKRQMIEMEIRLVEKRRNCILTENSWSNNNLEFESDDIFYDGNTHEDSAESTCESEIASFSKNWE